MYLKIRVLIDYRLIKTYYHLNLLVKVLVA